jgi:hypothetical protein
LILHLFAVIVEAASLFKSVATPVFSFPYCLRIRPKSEMIPLVKSPLRARLGAASAASDTANDKTEVLWQNRGQSLKVNRRENPRGEKHNVSVHPRCHRCA